MQRIVPTKLSELADLSYDVGYKKPPRHSQFAKGKSGNPNGRPRYAERWDAIFEDELSKLLPVTIDGQPTAITVLDAVIDAIAERAYAGSLGHADLLLRSEYSEPPRTLIVHLGTDIDWNNIDLGNDDDNDL